VIKFNEFNDNVQAPHVHVDGNWLN